VPVISVSGKVTLAGAPITAGHLSFALHGGGAAATSDFSGGATYSLTLVPGSYDVGFVPVSGCDGGTPCNGGVIKPGVTLTQSGALDVDVPVISVSGKVTLAGTPITAGALAFAMTGAFNRAVTAPLTASTYSITLLPGAYDIGFVADACNGGTPCNGGVIKPGVTLTQTGALDVDVPVISVGGKVTLGGAPISDGYIRFSLHNGYGPVDTPELSAAAASYALTLLPGLYDVGFVAPRSCNNATPCNGGVLKPQLTLTASGALDVDVPLITVAGKVTRGGAPIQGGALGFDLRGGFGEAATAGLSASAASYALALLPGSYDVRFIAPASCSGATPCNSGIVKPGLALGAGGALDVEVPLVTVSGKLTVQGQPWVSGDGGMLAFRPARNSLDAIAMLPAGATFTTALLPGNYVLMFGSGTCGSAGVPCDDEVLAGCP
jgi:hypothetical protein